MSIKRKTQTVKASTESKPRSRPKPDRSVQPLLYSREQVMQILGGMSASTIVRFEGEGKLTPVLFRQSKRARRYYKAAEVHALAQAESPPSS